MIHVRVKDELTARALRARLGRDFPVNALLGPDERVPGGTLITTTLDTSPRECVRLAAEGFAVVVLVPTKREPEQDEYLRAGARAYLEMRPDGTELVETVRALDTSREQRGVPIPGGRPGSPTRAASAPQCP